MTPRSPAGKVAVDRAVVAGGGDEDGAGGPGVVDGGLEGGRVAGVAEGHEDDVGARIGGVHDARDDVAVLAGPIGAEDGHRQDRDARVGGAGHADAVVGLGGDDAGHPGAVAVRIGPSRQRHPGPRRRAGRRHRGRGGEARRRCRGSRRSQCRRWRRSRRAGPSRCAAATTGRGMRHRRASASTARVRSASTRRTSAVARRAASSSASDSACSRIDAHRQLRDGVDIGAPAASRISSWRASEVPAAKVIR